jgi:hypothetical protein
MQLEDGQSMHDYADRVDVGTRVWMNALLAKLERFLRRQDGIDVASHRLWMSLVELRPNCPALLKKWWNKPSFC